MSVLCAFLQVLPLSPPLRVLASLKMSVDLWVSLWAGHWVVERVPISTWSTLLPTILSLHMEDFWISLLPMLHNVNWLVFRQAMNIPSQYIVSTVGVRRGVRVSHWQSFLKVGILTLTLVTTVVSMGTTITLKGTISLGGDFWVVCFGKMWYYNKMYVFN